MAHLTTDDGILIDTDGIRNAGKVGVLDHCGFGDFKVTTTAGVVHFDRMEGTLIPNQGGRAHRVSGNADAIAIVLAADAGAGDELANAPAPVVAA